VAKHLNSGQLSAILNMWRYRRTWYNPLMRTQNTLENSGNVDQAITTGNANSPGGLVNPFQDGVFAYSTPPGDTTPGVIAAGIINPPAIVAAHDAFN
jgi:hypothetical protein